jgi:hypothetical protein
MDPVDHHSIGPVRFVQFTIYPMNCLMVALIQIRVAAPDNHDKHSGSLVKVVKADFVQ